MSYFGNPLYFGVGDAAGAAQFHSYGAGNDSIIDDVFEVIQREAIRPNAPPFLVWESYSQANDEDGVVITQESTRYVLQNEETIDVRFTSQATSSRKAQRIVKRCVEALEKDMMTQIVRRDGMDISESDNTESADRYMAAQVVEVR